MEVCCLNKISKTKDPCCLRQSGDNVVLAGRLTRATRDSRVRRKACSVEERKERKGVIKGGCGNTAGHSSCPITFGIFAGFDTKGYL